MAKQKLIWRYLNFDLSVEPSPDGKGSRAKASIPGGAVGKTTFLYSPRVDQADATESDGGATRDLKQATASRAPDGRLGGLLFERVFSREVGRLWEKARARLKMGQGLRLRLRLSEEVSDWPWEQLHDGSEFLVDAEEISIVHFPELPRGIKALRVHHPLRLLVVASCPRGQEPLQLEEEWKQILSALNRLIRKKRVQVDRLSPPTLTELLKRVGDNEYHVLHFMGHGTFDSAKRTGVLLFEDAEKGQVRVTGEELARLLGAKSIRLVILNACEGARCAPENKFAGVAHGLMRKGIPAVVAMRWAIDDLTAVAFAQSFYAALVKVRILDRAMTAGRKRLLAERSGSYEWANPVLFLRAHNGRIFKWGPRPRNLVAAGVLGGLIVLGGIPLYKKLTLPPPPPSHPPIPADPACPSPKGVDMVLVQIPAGRFLMGSAGEEDNESPIHLVTISRPFCLGVQEVSQRQWTQVMGQPGQQREQGNDLPKALVTWFQAQEFVKRLNELEGQQVFRLPTEAEWEYAVRGPRGSPSEPGNCLHGDHYDGLAPAGSYRTNDWNLYDMNGNVWEWVEDWYGFYDSGKFTDPAGPLTGDERVKRGGSYDSANKHCRPSRRNSQKPGTRANDVGFRIVREIANVPGSKGIAEIRPNEGKREPTASRKP